LVHRLRFGAGALLASVLTAAAPAFAQPVIVPPAPQSVPAPTQDGGATEISVELELTISVTGDVREVRVVSAPQRGFDEAAVAALSNARFVPAARDGTAVPVRIRYVYVFPAAPPPPAEPEPEAPAAPAPPPIPAAEAPVDDQAAFGARAVTEAPPREATARSMNGTELAKIGTRGDPIRAVELLPGFARTTFGQTSPIIRGSTGSESQVFLEGVPVPLLYHFGGITSFVPARAIERIDYYPGNFSARYGRVLGGVVDVRLRDPRADGPHGVLDASFLDASIFGEGPVAGRRDDGTAQVTSAVGFRRSYVDVYFANIAPAGLTVEAAPVYFDYQAIVRANLGADRRLRVFVYGSQDRFEVIQSKPDDTDPSVRGRFDLKTAFHHVQASMSSRLSERFTEELSVALGVEQYRQRAGSIVNQDASSLSVRARGEWTYRATDDVRLTFGVDHDSHRWSGTYDGVRPPVEGAVALPPSLIPRTAALSVEHWVHAPALYVEAPLVLGGRVTAIPSVRADYLDSASALTIDPRLVVRARVAPATVLKAGVGKFTQHPEAWQSFAGIGNPQLEPGWALHVSTGIEQGLGESAKIGAEVFGKSLQHLPVATQSFEAPYYTNDGRGRVYGLELEARVLPRERVYGLLAYTLSRSERARRDEALRLFDNDQTHVGSAAVVARLGRGWEAGATMRVTSANPKTPALGAVYDARTDTYTPRYGALNSARDALYHRLDLHVEKTWSFQSWRLMVYADIQNVYFSKNAETSTYNYDYTRSTPTTSFPPFFPSLGIRGEL
jgi:TonB family protein